MGFKNILIYRALMIVIGAFVLFSPTYSQDDDVFHYVWKQDFTDTPVGLYTEEQVKIDWNNPPWVNGDDMTYIVDLYGDKAMQFNIPPGTTHSWEGGGEWWAPLPPGHEEIYFTYNIMFKPGFDWVLGGKLPGLGGVNNPTGGQEVPWDAGFTARVMFSEVKTYDENYPDGKFILYVYHQNKKGKYGDVFQLDPARFPVDDSIWHNLTMRVVLNTVGSSGGNADGLLEFFLDGKHIMTKTGMKYRNLNSIWIDTQHIVTFFGGSGDIFAPKKDEWMFMDDFASYYYKDGVNVVRGRTPTPSGSTIPIPNSKHGMKPAPPPPPPVEPEPSDSTPPSVPTGLVELVTSGTVMVLGWNPSTDDDSGVDGYRVFLNGAENQVMGKNETQAIIHDLLPETSYSVAVTAFDVEGNESAPSQSLPFATSIPDIIPPDPPGGLLQVDETQSSVRIEWEASVDNVAIDRYEIYVNGEAVGLDKDQTLTYTINGLTPDTEYTVTVVAFDLDNNESDPSQPLSILTLAPDLEPPTVPTNLGVTIPTQSSLTVAWSPSTDNVAVTGYNIQVNGIPKGSSLTNSFTITGLSPGISYIVGVSAYDAAGNESARVEEPFETRNPDISVDPSLPTVEIQRISTIENKSNSTTAINAYGHTELQDYGLAFSTDMEFSSENRIVYASKEVTGIQLDGRVSEGLQVLYHFNEQEGGRIVNQAPDGVGAEADLVIKNPLETNWLPGKGLKVSGNTTITTEEVPTQLLSRISSSNEVTLEAWVRPSQLDQSGPARILTLSKDHLTRAATLGHEGNQALFNYIARLYTSESGSANGLPEVSTTQDYISLNLHHVVFTRNSSGQEYIYVNGIQKYAGNRAGTLEIGGEEYFLSLSNEVNGDRPWFGTFYMAAIYNQALSQEEVVRNLDAGIGQIEYQTSLNDLEPNIPYYLRAFTRTDQGIVYGEVESLLLGNVNYSDVEDSLYMAIYPNPGDGEFTVRVQCGLKDFEPSFLRITDIHGTVIFNEPLELTECGVIRYPYVFSEESNLIDESGIMEFQYNLSAIVGEGIYNVMLIAGNAKVAQRMVIMAPRP